MQSMTALEAKNAFGQFLESAQREPVMLTKNNRPVAALFSVRDIAELAQALLPGASLPEGRQPTGAELVDALMRQARMDNKIAQSRAEIAAGEGIEMDAAYFDALHARIAAKSVPGK